MSKGRQDEQKISADSSPSGTPRTPSNADSSVLGAVAGKSCCICGTDLHGRTRFKDGQGRYWCPPCNEKDQLSKEPASCPDCNAQFTRADLVEFKGTPVCQECWDKRKHSAKREEARLRAVEEAIQEETDRKKRMKRLALIVLAIVGLWGILMLLYWLMRQHS